MDLEDATQQQPEGPVGGRAEHFLFWKQYYAIGGTMTLAKSSSSYGMSVVCEGCVLSQTFWVVGLQIDQFPEPESLSRTWTSGKE